MVMQGRGGATRGDATTSQQSDANGKRGAIGRERKRGVVVMEMRILREEGDLIELIRKLCSE